MWIMALKTHCNELLRRQTSAKRNVKLQCRRITDTSRNRTYDLLLQLQFTERLIIQTMLYKEEE